MSYIPLDDCKHGGLYRVSARNFDLGVYDEATHGFIGIRHKFGELYLFTEFHWDTGEPYGTAKPRLALEFSPFQGEAVFDAYRGAQNHPLFDYLTEAWKRYGSTKHPGG